MIDYLRLVEAIDPETLPADTLAVTVIVSPDVYGWLDPETGENGLVSPAVHRAGLYVLAARDQVDEALWAEDATLAEIDRESGAMLRGRDVEGLTGCTLSPQWAGAAGLPLAMAEPDIEGRKVAMRREVDALWALHQATGYDHDFGAPGVHRLQTRETDLPYWLALAQTASIQIGLGHGDVPHGAIRTADNVNVPVTASQALAAMLGMQAHLGAILAHSWALKDEVMAAEGLTALDAIDVSAGWPA